jgi:hypothetical protein
MRTKDRWSWSGLFDFWPPQLVASLIPKGCLRLCPRWPRQEPSWRALAGRRDAIVGATVLLWGATEECLDIRSPAGCPAFAWPNSNSAGLDDGVRPCGAPQKVEFAAADRLTVDPAAFE